MQKHRAKTKAILVKATTETMEPDAMELDAVLVNHMTTLAGATIPLTAARGVKHKNRNETIFCKTYVGILRHYAT